MADERSRPERATTHDDAGAPALHDDVGTDHVVRDRADELRRVVLHKSVRRARARRRGRENVWSFMGMFGLVGWTVAVPALLGVALGVYLDRHVESSISFTITFLVVGVSVGASMAWYWIRRESEGDDES